MVTRELIEEPKFKKSLSKLELLGLKSYLDIWVKKEYPSITSHAELMNLDTDEIDFFTLIFSDTDESFWIDEENWGAYFAVTLDDVIVLATTNSNGQVKLWEV